MLKVLIVDDKEENIYLMQALLEYNDFQTILAMNGDEALKVLRGDIPDLIISDILMPVMDGFTLCRECKKDDRLKHIPFFFYTATYTDSRDEEYALNLGADRFILKPQEPDDFLLIINDYFATAKKNETTLKEVTQVSEVIVLKEYNEVLVRKIEDKMLQSEKAEKELRVYATLLENEITERKKAEEGNKKLIADLENLTNSVKELSSARDLDSILKIVRISIHDLIGADGSAFIMRDGDFCFYADGDIIANQWIGKRIPLNNSISGWTMLNKQPAIIEDIYTDPRVNSGLYEFTTVKSLVMIPLNMQEPIGAIGNYWSEKHIPSTIEIQLLQTLADSTFRAIENVRLYQELEKRVEARTLELEMANKELEAFSYSVSHDLRTPLRHISGFINIFLGLKASQLTDEELECLNNVTNSVDDMGKLIEALLSFSRLTRTELQKSQIDTIQLLQSGLQLFEEEIRTRSIEIKIDLLQSTFGDFQLMSQVWTNLISNAIKYTGKSGKPLIEIGSYTESDETVFFIKDNGVGFNMKYVDKLFGVFQRLHKLRDFEGIGIGLANVNRIITRHGGRCWAEGEVDNGATFYFSLPENKPQ
ncbi:MAG: response regulator [Bacteroidetes bacterium]|nr:response regulator [Bacteroidota bacterium]